MPVPGPANPPDDLPAPIARALAESYRAPFPVPADADHVILDHARRVFALRSRPWYARRQVALLAAAAGLALAATAWFAVLRAGRLPGDVNGDGRVDILDALALARAVETHKPTPARFDLNHDGRVDRRDADAIAMSAVTLGGGA